MGAGSLALSVLAFSAPLAVVSGFIPLTIMFGGRGAPVAYVISMIILLLFSAGYVTMTRRVPKPGDFYSFISTGLGNVAGLGAAFLALVSYLVLLAGTCAFLGITVQGLIVSLGGPSTPWWLWSLVGWVIVGILGYLHIDLSAKVLTVAMILEIAVVMIFNVFTIAKGGADGLSVSPLRPSEFFSGGDIGVTLLFCMTMFLGFEATALFRDEVRQPNRTIPRATYGAVAFIGVLYALSCFALVTAGGANAVAEATANPAGMFSASIGHFVAPAFTQISNVFLTTSLLAALISIHNVMARYAHNLSFDYALPRYMAIVHIKHGSPHRASVLISALTAVILFPLALFGIKPETLYASMCGLGGVGVMFLMALVSVAVIAWFAMNRNPHGDSPFKVYVAPALAALALGATVVLAIVHFDYIVGGSPGQNDWLLGVLAGALLVGGGLALFYRTAKPEIYARLGRADRVVDLNS